jgi:zinc-ribbon domain
VAIQCARCGAQNPDGNLYCQSCGTPLTVQAPAQQAPTAQAPMQPPSLAGPPTGMAPPTFSQSGYQSPYYAPSGVAVPVHRAPWMLIIAAVVALVVLLAGFGTVFALVANRGGNNTAGAGVGDVPSPTPAVSPSPIASPTTPPSTTGTTESNGGETVPVPAGWSVAAKDNESIVLSDPNSQGSVSLGSGPSVPTQTAQDNKTTVDDYFKSKYPDVRDCPSTSAKATTFNGASGISWTLCFTLTSGSSAIPAAASLFAGANKSGSVYYAVMVLTRQDNLQSYLNVAKPVLQGVVWKLS